MRSRINNLLFLKTFIKHYLNKKILYSHIEKSVKKSMSKQSALQQPISSHAIDIGFYKVSLHHKNLFHFLLRSY